MSCRGSLVLEFLHELLVFRRGMISRIAQFPVLLLACALVTSCATRRLPKYEKPIARTELQTVRTTAYTHTESDHREYSNRSALGTVLRSGEINSASADWSRWPAGTIFKLLDTGEMFVVDDYGWALSGTNTIDLYKPSRSAMNRWGVRRVNIQVVCWGDDRQSYTVLEPRAKHKHVRRMLEEMRRNGSA
jgi:3D (Asp-Asp-Asp) domain-containing protein